MIEVTAWLIDNKVEASYAYSSRADLESIKTKIISQMNNGNTVVLGEDKEVLLNPKYIQCILIEVTGENE